MAITSGTLATTAFTQEDKAKLDFLYNNASLKVLAGTLDESALEVINKILFDGNQFNVDLSELGTVKISLKNNNSSGTTNKFVYISTNPTVEHIVTHNLNTKEFVSEVFVQGLDGIWRKEIVYFEIVDNNTIKIKLTEGANIILTLIY